MHAGVISHFSPLLLYTLTITQQNYDTCAHVNTLIKYHKTNEQKEANKKTEYMKW